MGGTQDSHFTSLPTASGLYLHLAQQKSSACQAQISEIPSQNNKFPMGREGTTLSHLLFGFEASMWRKISSDQL